MARWKTFTKKKLWHHSFQGLWFVQMAYVYAKFRAWCHSFQPIKEHYLCVVVFSLLFSIIVDLQHQASNSITTQSNNKNSKQLSQFQVDPSVTCWSNVTIIFYINKNHRYILNNLSVNASDVMLKHWHKIKLYCPRNYNNESNEFLNEEPNWKSNLITFWWLLSSKTHRTLQ